MKFIQYQVVIVNLDSTLGGEMKKTRPCVIISPNELNNTLRIIVVAPLTSNTKPRPTRVAVNFQEKSGVLAHDQIRTVDKMRITKAVGFITAEEILQVKQVLKEIFVD